MAVGDTLSRSRSHRRRDEPAESPGGPVLPAYADEARPGLVPVGPMDLRPAPAERFSLLRVPILPAGVRESRHRLLIAVLAVHVPAVLLLGADRGDVGQAGLLALPLLAAVLLARFAAGRMLRSSAVVLGLAWSSYAALHLTAGDSGAHLQPLFVVALLALYQDPALLGLGLLAEVLALAVPAQLQPSLVLMGAELRTPWTTVLVQAAALLGVGVAASLAWRRDVPVPVFADPAPQPAAGPDPAALEHLARARSAELALARRQTSYALMTSLARRNQSLIGRQLATLDDLERDERDPDVLAGLFALDHLATRMRRNAENLLVLAGAPATSRGFAQPVPVEELLRGAAAEVEQYARVDVSVGVGGSVAGHVVSDVAHLLAELLDNALACSPPDSQVTVGAALGEAGTLRMWVADEGIGMTTTRLAEHNAQLRLDADERELGATLGFPVVRRLAARHAIVVTLGTREGGRSGLVAYVDLPPDLVVVLDRAGDGRPPSAAVPSAPAALPGRRAARRAAAMGNRGRRNELAVDAKRDTRRDGPGEDGFFAPAPLPAAGSGESPVELWGTPDPAPGEGQVETALRPARRSGDRLPQRGAAPAAATAATRDRSPAPVVPLPESLDDEAHPPTLSAAVSAWSADEPARAPLVELRGGPAGRTVVPAARTPLTRRVPQQALIEAGGSIEPTTFEPGPEPVAPTTASAPTPVRAQDLLATYRAGLARARVPSPAEGSGASGGGDVQTDRETGTPGREQTHDQ